MLLRQQKTDLCFFNRKLVNSSVERCKRFPAFSHSFPISKVGFISAMLLLSRQLADAFFQHGVLSDFCFRQMKNQKAAKQTHKQVKTNRQCNAGMPNLYGILKISRDASQAEVRAAYKRQALQVHPDKGGSSLAFQQVVAAFEQLADPLLRQAYDERCQKINLRSPSLDKAGIILKKTRKACPEKGFKKAQQKAFPTKKFKKESTSEKKTSWKQRFLAKVVKLLKVLLPEDRKMVFECRLVQAQRLELESFMKETKVEAPLEATKSGASKVIRSLGFHFCLVFKTWVLPVLHILSHMLHVWKPLTVPTFDMLNVGRYSSFHGAYGFCDGWYLEKSYIGP